jgi:hypothetical protein
MALRTLRPFFPVTLCSLFMCLVHTPGARFLCFCVVVSGLHPLTRSHLHCLYLWVCAGEAVRGCSGLWQPETFCSFKMHSLEQSFVVTRGTWLTLARSPRRGVHALSWRAICSWQHSRRAGLTRMVCVSRNQSEVRVVTKPRCTKVLTGSKNTIFFGGFEVTVTACAGTTHSNGTRLHLCGTIGAFGRFTGWALRPPMARDLDCLRLIFE